MTKQNCWEFKNCGREPNGSKINELGICPSATETRLDGVHGGKNAGRACWIVAGTLCSGKLQGTFAQKYHNCMECDFCKTVINDLGLEMSIELLNKLRKNNIEQ
jgi:hypothetical protein